MSKSFYADKFFEDENGRLYTGEYIDHNDYLRSKHTFKDVTKNAYENLRGKTVSCNYDQIFYPDSNMILCNSIVEKFGEEMWDGLKNGNLTTYYDNDGNECDVDDAVDEREEEIFQYYIIDNGTAKRLKNSTEEIIFYIESLDIYVLGVTHFGTSWDYVGTEYMF